MKEKQFFFFWPQSLTLRAAEEGGNASDGAGQKAEARPNNARGTHTHTDTHTGTTHTLEKVANEALESRRRRALKVLMIFVLLTHSHTHTYTRSHTLFLTHTRTHTHTLRPLQDNELLCKHTAALASHCAVLSIIIPALSIFKFDLLCKFNYCLAHTHTHTGSETLTCQSVFNE